MNENPAGTPNPLNPAAPSEPVAPNGSVAPNEPVVSGAPVVPTSPASEPIQTEPVHAESIQNETAQVEPMAGQPAINQMATEQPADAPQMVEVVKPLKMSKTPIIVIAIIFILVAIGLAVAAIMVLNPFASHDAVPAAISKLFSEGAPQNVRMQGTIKTYDNSEYAISPNILVSFSSNINSATAENTAAINVSATLQGDSTFTFDADEIHTANGDFYLKLSNISSALTNYKTLVTDCVDDESGMTDCLGGEELQTTECRYDDYDTTECESLTTDVTNCVGDESGMTNCTVEETSMPSALDFIEVFDVIDDEWIKIPKSQFSTIISVASGAVSDGSTFQCLVDAAGKLGEYGDNLTALYKENPFIEYSTADISISAKKDTLYRLFFNSEKLTSFINGIGNSGFANELMACTGGTAVNTAIIGNQLSEVLQSIPEIYVEIDDKDNFTRLYMAMQSENGLAGAVVDISFEYPTSPVTIEEPEDYIELGDFLSQLLSGFYGTDIVE